MQNFEHTPNQASRADVLRAEIEALRKNKIANTSDPEFAAEIQEEIEAREAKLREIEETRH